MGRNFVEDKWKRVEKKNKKKQRSRLMTLFYNSLPFPGNVVRSWFIDWCIIVIDKVKQTQYFGVVLPYPMPLEEIEKRIGEAFGT